MINNGCLTDEKEGNKGYGSQGNYVYQLAQTISNTTAFFMIFQMSQNSAGECRTSLSAVIDQVTANLWN